jgi:hypothetical protein
MKLYEVKEGEDTRSLQVPEDNEFEKASKMDTRRPRLTLEHLGKLRRMREIRKLEMENRKELYTRIYQRPPPGV